MNKKVLKRMICIVIAAALLLISAGCGGKTDGEKTSENQTDKATGNNTSALAQTTAETTTKKIDASPDDKLIALTFDDGPYSPVTERILDVLEKNGARATFFVVGNRVASYKSSVERAAKLGCEIGSHTYTHQNLTKVGVDGIRSQLEKTNDAVSKITGHDITVLRPPEGAVNDTVRANVNYPLVLWSVDSKDWKYRNAAKDYDNVVNNVFDGCIVLMHDLYPATADAVTKFVPELVAKGYKFVTFSELMELRGVKLENGVKYFSAKPKNQAGSGETTADKAVSSTAAATTATTAAASTTAAVAKTGTTSTDIDANVDYVE